jgi:long-chain acyl-CoA synthetase
VQLKPGASATEEDLKRHVAARLAAFKVPVRIVLEREPLPRNASGKIMKRELRGVVGGHSSAVSRGSER